MMSLLKRWFKRWPPRATKPGETPEKHPVEHYTAVFIDKEKAYFEEVQEERYAAHYVDQALELHLRRCNLFAWSSAAGLSAGDFFMEASFSTNAGLANETTPQHQQVNNWAAGFIFHMAANDSFMYVLVGSGGSIHLERVFNGEPTTITAWTECPWVDTSQPINLKLIARGNHYLALVNDQLALEADDESLEFGSWAFAAQNYSYFNNITCRLLEFQLEANPMRIEQAYIQYAKKQDFAAGQRRRLAASAMALRQWPVVWQQLTKLQDRESLTAEDHFLLAEAYIQAELYTDSEQQLKICLALDPEHKAAREEVYNLLYLQSRYAELHTSLGNSPELATNPRQQNLLGHALDNLGKYTAAAEAYAEAARLDPAMPIYSQNAARALEKISSYAEAAAHWLSAARSFLSQEAAEDARECIDRLRLLGFDKAELAAMDSRLAWLRGDYDTVETLLAPLVKKNKADANSCYLYGLLLSSRQQRAEAGKVFKKAVDLDDHNPAFLFKYAESLYLDGKDYQPAIDMALQHCPSDGWIRNLAGTIALHKNELSEASAHFRQARAVLPTEADPAINLATSLAMQHQADAGLAELADFPTDAAVANARGNILSGVGRLDAAADEYRRACDLASQRDPLDPISLSDYYTNLGACFIELEQWANAGEALRKALERHTSNDSLMLMGDVWQQTGEYVRAETAWQSALELNPQSAPLLSRLAASYCQRGQYAAATALLSRLEALEPATAAKLARQITAATSQNLYCSECRLEWTLPRDVPKVARLQVRGELPDHSPAGSCPSCGKVLCVACGKQHLMDKRFTCPDCATHLNLNDDRLRYLVVHTIKEAAKKAGT